MLERESPVRIFTEGRRKIAMVMGRLLSASALTVMYSVIGKGTCKKYLDTQRVFKLYSSKGVKDPRKAALFC